MPKSRTASEVILLSKLLDLHLYLGIKKARAMANSREPMNRHLELTARLKGIKVKRNARFDELDVRVDKHETKDNENFDNFEKILTADEKLVEDFGKEVEAELGNGPEDGVNQQKSETKKEGDGETVAKFPQTGGAVGTDKSAA